MNPNEELEQWQRIAIRLAVMLYVAMPKKANAFLYLDQKVRRTLLDLTDAGLDLDVLTDPRLKHLLGSDVCERMLDLEGRAAEYRH